MTNPDPAGSTPHTIADIERDTGLSKDTLRVWERRYGFPQPQRDALGERRYDDDTLLRLRHVRRLLDAGHRPGQVVPLPLEQLLALQAPARPPRRRPAVAPAPVAGDPGLAQAWLALLRRHELGALRQHMQQHLNRLGLAVWLQHGVAPMNTLVGQAWLAGELAVFEEHLYSELVQVLLRQALTRAVAARQGQPPRVLITTVLGEPHALGVLMAECMLALEGCETVSLGTQTPLPDIVSAARACRADIVALGFSAALNPRDVQTALDQLQLRLPPGLELWTGGQCPALLKRRRAAAPHTHLGRLEDIAPAVAAWRARAAGG